MTANANARTVNELLDRYEKDVVPRLGPRTRKDYLRHINRLREVFGKRVAVEVQPAEIDAFMHTPEGEKGSVQRNRILSVFSETFKKAVKLGWLTYNPCRQVKRNPTKKQHRRLTEEELAGLRKLAKPHIRVIVDLALLTRESQGNLLKLTWDQVDFDNNVIRFRNPKKRQEKVEVEITPEIRRVLDECRAMAKKSDHVLNMKISRGGPYTGEGFRAVWQRLMRKWVRRGNDRFTFHHLRKTAQERHAQRQARRAQVASAFADFPQFEQSLTEEAAAMSAQYQLFYCLEQTMRAFVVARLVAAEGANWWNTPRVPDPTRIAANGLRQKEITNGITPRSSSMIDYITFGELSGLITSNWDVFEPAFHHHKDGIIRVIANLNLGRGPIAHSCAMSSHEIERLQLWIKDWFKQVK